MRLLIHDANVLIDLLDIGLLDEAMAVPYIMETTDLVEYEIVDTEQASAIKRCTARGLLTVLSSTKEQLTRIGEMQNNCPKLTLADCSVVYFAQIREGIVLSGDGRLRKEAEHQHLEVHSTPWLLDLMVSVNLLAPKTAIEKLKQLMDINQRLPRNECLSLIEAWERLVG